MKKEIKETSTKIEELANGSFDKSPFNNVSSYEKMVEHLMQILNHFMLLFYSVIIINN